jgi:hypothetical protein
VSGQLKIKSHVSRLEPKRREVSPDPGGNRAQRRAWKKLTKKNGASS